MLSCTMSVQSSEPGPEAAASVKQPGFFQTHHKGKKGAEGTEQVIQGSPLTTVHAWVTEP